MLPPGSQYSLCLEKKYAAEAQLIRFTTKNSRLSFNDNNSYEQRLHKSITLQVIRDQIPNIYTTSASQEKSTTSGILKQLKITSNCCLICMLKPTYRSENLIHQGCLNVSKCTLLLNNYLTLKYLFIYKISPFSLMYVLSCNAWQNCKKCTSFSPCHLYAG